MIDPKQIGSNPYLAVPAWFISWAGGNDQATGTTIGAPLKTFAELFKRLGTSNGPAFTTPTVTITVIDHNPADHIAAAFLNRIVTANAVVTIIAAGNTVLQTGTITAVRAKNTATNTPFGVTDSAIPGGIWPIGRRVKILTGAAAGAWFWTLKDEGAQVARITSPSVDEFTPITPAIGDTYQIETLTDLYVANIASKGFGITTSTVNVTDFNVRSTVSANIIAVQDSLRILNFNRCNIANNINIQNAINTRFFNSFFASLITVSINGYSSASLFLGGGIGSSVAINLRSTISSEGWLGQNRPIDIAIGSNGQGSDYGCMDCVTSSVNPAGDGLLIGTKFNNVVAAAPSSWNLNLGGRIWGAGHVGWGVSLGPNCLLEYQAAADRPTITGTSGDFRTASVGSLQQSVGRNGATQVEEGPFNNTWVNLATASPAGFGDAATDTRTGARVINLSRVFT